jgi:hypothetical protein
MAYGAWLMRRSVLSERLDFNRRAGKQENTRDQKNIFSQTAPSGNEKCGRSAAICGTKFPVEKICAQVARH